jgi:hypothetical protein
MTSAFHPGSIVTQTILGQLNESRMAIDTDKTLEFEFAHGS